MRQRKGLSSVGYIKGFGHESMRYAGRFKLPTAFGLLNFEKAGNRGLAVLDFLIFNFDTTGLASQIFLPATGKLVATSLV
jgi:hypothetical protein